MTLLILRPDSWETTRYLTRHLIRWAFRGHENASWNLDTTLHRNAQQFGCETDWLYGREAWMLRQFQRRAHHYINDPPSYEQRLEWLALIQHYGGPTRLLDFTHSFYVAAFFALERATQDAAVWGINLEILEKAIRKKLKLGPMGEDEDIDKINTKLIELADIYLRGESSAKLVLHVEPDRMNERLSIQQSLFLFPCDICSSFEDNLAATFNFKSAIFKKQKEISISRKDITSLDMDNKRFIKIILPQRSIQTALNDLHDMNVTSATLFPGLDGFARSLYYHLRSLTFDEEFFDRFNVPE
ncbi:MAG: FRG domain-containing protein [Pyrinomonadaceae bacterium]